MQPRYQTEDRKLAKTEEIKEKKDKPSTKESNLVTNLAKSQSFSKNGIPIADLEVMRTKLNQINKISYQKPLNR